MRAYNRRKFGGGLTSPHGADEEYTVSSDLEDSAKKERRRKKQLEYVREASKIATLVGDVTGKQSLSRPRRIGQEGVDQYGGSYASEGAKGLTREAGQAGAQYAGYKYLRNKKGLGAGKSGAAVGAASAVAEGDAKGAGEAALAGAAQARKIQQFRMIWLAIRTGSALTIVGIVITILIWGVQLVVGHMMGREKWKMTKIELPLAILVWGLIIIVVGTQLMIYVTVMYYLREGILGIVTAVI